MICSHDYDSKYILQSTVKLYCWRKLANLFICFAEYFITTAICNLQSNDSMWFVMTDITNWVSKDDLEKYIVSSMKI